MKELTINKNDSGQRLDRFLSKSLPHLPPSLLARLIRKKHFRVNGRHVPPDFRLSEGDRLSMYLTDEQLCKPPESEEWRLVKPDVSVAYEDAHVLIADKPAGLLCHSDNGGSPDTLINRIRCLLASRGEWDPGAEQSFVPALANRIDRNTCGLVIAAKSAEALRGLNELIKERKIGKFYLCTVNGRPGFSEKTLTGWLEKDERTNTVTVCRSPGPNRLTAVTKVRVLRSDGNRSTLECELLTGRTHQIRAQLSDAGYPICGDTKYGRSSDGRRGQDLCSYKLVFPALSGALSGVSGKTVCSRFAAKFDVRMKSEDKRV